MKEVWKDVPGYEGKYSVSDLGRTKGPNGIINGYYRKHNGIEYRIISLYKNGYSKKVLVHSLVLEAFAGPRPDGMQCCHNDGDSKNNKLENLRYDTPKGNAKDKILHGTDNRGERCSRSKLTEKEVLEISILSKNKDISYKEISERYNVTQQAVGMIARGDNWNWLTGNKERGFRKNRYLTNYEKYLIKSYYYRFDTTCKILADLFDSKERTVFEVIQNY